MGRGGGASEGLGAAFADDLANRGINLVLIAGRPHLLEEAVEGIRRKHGTEVRCLARDLADPGLSEDLRAATDDIEIGVLVYNAAFVPLGQFADLDEETLVRVVRTNARTPEPILCSTHGALADPSRSNPDHCCQHQRALMAHVKTHLQVPPERQAPCRELPRISRDFRVWTVRLDTPRSSTRLPSRLRHLLSAD